MNKENDLFLIAITCDIKNKNNLSGNTIVLNSVHFELEFQSPVSAS